MVMGNRNQLQWDLPALDSYELIRAIYRLPQAEFRRDPRRAHRAARPRRARTQAGPQPLARRADEGRDRRRAAPSAAGPVPRRAHDRPRRHHAEADPIVRRRVQPAVGRDGPADQPLHGRRPGAVPAGDRHPPRPDPVRRRAGGPRRPVRCDEDDRGHAARRRGRPVGVRRGPARPRTAGRRSAVAAGRRARGHEAAPAELPVADLTIEDPPIEDVIEHVFADAGDGARDGGWPRAPRTSRAADRRRAPTIGRGAVAAARGWVDFYADHDADRDRGAVPVPGRELLLHDRHGRRAGRSTSSSGRRSRTSRAARSAASRRASSPRTTSSGRWSGT